MANEADMIGGKAASVMSVAQALAVIDAAEVFSRAVEVELGRARGLRLAEELKADRDYPPVDKSQMDGYAVRSADAVAGAVLRVVGESAAGSGEGREVGGGESVAIMTGARVWRGADAVVPVEDVEVLEGGAAIRVSRGVGAGKFIARRGSDVHGEVVVLQRGQRLEAAEMAVAASIGAKRVRVYAQPRVGVLATGDELVGVGEAAGEGQVRNSNSPMLMSLLEKMGCAVVDLGRVGDESGAIREGMERGMGEDVLFVTGGMSMGRYDYVPGVLKELGMVLQISKVRIKPGKPFVFASGDREEGGRRFVFGLPGNPVSGFICTVRLASRLLERMGGGTAAESASERWVTGRLVDGLLANGAREFYQPAVLTVAGGVKSVQNELASIRPLDWKGSADVFTLARANALIVRGENEPASPKGTLIRVIQI